MKRFILLSLMVFLCACPKKDDRETAPSGGGTDGTVTTPPPTGDRTPAVDANDPLYARVEGTSFKNTCANDAVCFKGGCSSEVCSAEDGVNTTCEMPAKGWPSQGASCGCVSGECIWYRAPGSGTGTGTGGAIEGQGATCTNGQCAAGLECVEYYGVAGPKGPKFTSCEIKCPKAGATCANGQLCVTIADGPGTVCRTQGPDKPAKLDEKQNDVQ